MACTIWRDVSAGTPSTQDIYGSSTSSNVNTASYSLVTTTTCGVSQPSGTHLQNYDFLIGAEASWLAHVPVGTNIQERDHIVTGGPLPASNQYPSSTLYPDIAQILEVHVVLTPRSYPALLDVLCAEIK
jgi:hypothetical protein